MIKKLSDRKNTQELQEVAAQINLVNLLITTPELNTKESLEKRKVELEEYERLLRKHPAFDLQTILKKYKNEWKNLPKD